MIGLLLTSDSIDQIREENKKGFHLIDKEYVESYERFKDDKELHAEIIGSDSYQKEDDRTIKYKIDIR